MVKVVVMVVIKVVVLVIVRSFRSSKGSIAVTFTENR